MSELIILECHNNVAGAKGLKVLPFRGSVRYNWYQRHAIPMTYLGMMLRFVSFIATQDDTLTSILTHNSQMRQLHEIYRDNIMTDTEGCCSPVGRALKYQERFCYVYRRKQ